jgi:membrane protein required for colicin V production
MNFVDFIIIAILVLFVIQGFRKGLIYEVASLAGLILGIYASFHFSAYLQGYLVEYLDISEKYSYLTAFILVFIVVVILVHFIGKIIENIIDMVALGFLNKLAGSVFGILKAIVLLSLTMLVLNHFNSKWISMDKKNESLLYRPIESVAPLLWKGFEQYGKEKIPDENLPVKT